MKELVQIIPQFPKIDYGNYNENDFKEYYLFSTPYIVTEYRSFTFLGEKSDLNFQSELEKINGTDYEIELCIFLNELFPNKEDKLDYEIEVRNSLGEIEKILISNQMSMIRFIENKDQKLYFSNMMNIYKGIEQSNFIIPEGVGLERLRSTIFWKKRIKGDSLKKFIEENWEDTVNNFFYLVNRFFEAYLLLKGEIHPLSNAGLNKNNFSEINFAIKGTNGVFVNKMVSNGFLYIKNPGNFEEKDFKELSDIILEKIEKKQYKLYFNTAKTHLFNGNLSFAFLQLIMSVEICLTQFIHKRLKSKGVSGKKIKDYANDITFSECLNLYLFAVTSDSEKPNLTDLGEINKMRVKRNKFVHEGIFDISQEELLDFIIVVKRFNEYIEKMNL